MTTIVSKKYHTIISRPQTLLFVVLVMMSIGSISCSNKLEELPNEDSSIWEQERAENVTYLFGQDGNTKAKLFTKKFTRYDKSIPPYIDMTDSIYVEFYNQNLEIENTLTAKSGRFYTSTEDIILNDDIIITTKTGKIIKTDELIWNSKIEKIYSEKPVTIIQGEQITYGTGLEANQTFSWVIIHNLRGSMPVDNDKMNEEISNEENK